MSLSRTRQVEDDGQQKSEGTFPPHESYELGHESLLGRISNPENACVDLTEVMMVKRKRRHDPLAIVLAVDLVMLAVRAWTESVDVLQSRPVF